MTRHKTTGAIPKAAIRKPRSKSQQAAATVVKKVVKKQPWPFAAEDNPIGLAMVHVDAILDRISRGKLKAIDQSTITQLQKLTTAEIKTLFAGYKTTLVGIKSAISGDAFDMEAYSNFTKPRLKLALEYLKSLKTIQPDAKATGRKIRLKTASARKTKEKPPEKVVQKALYCVFDEETGVTSLKPQEALGASELWIYNIKTRKLGCYHAANEKGLTIKGTTVTNYNVEKSTTKMIRRPKSQVQEFLQGKIQWMRGYWNAIRAVPQAIPPRLSRETLILKAHR